MKIGKNSFSHIDGPLKTLLLAIHTTFIIVPSAGTETQSTMLSENNEKNKAYWWAPKITFTSANIFSKASFYFLGNITK